MKMMRTFIGNIDAKFDDKGRVFIPAAYRKILSDEESLRLVMRRDTDNACLVFYPERVWNQRVDQLHEALDDWNPEDELLLMQYVSEAELLEPDNQGRVLLNKKNMEHLGAKQDLVFVGMLDRFALWSREQYDERRMDQRELSERIRAKMAKKVNG
ncbi:MAG: cell division/cell wall cluster transcriptional repressor MraZ [Paludibacteraceae bacterium]|nr:cell division/cell wall cluster transcriptional repressor MraZ [Paludibacteraceae bacterium]